MAIGNTSTTASTSSAEFFGNNAFSDFSPLLTLFGDEVTKQFLATSMGVSDNVLLGIAPIGIMTIIVSAIRVGGTRFMKSLIGRFVSLFHCLNCNSCSIPDIWKIRYL